MLLSLSETEKELIAVNKIIRKIPAFFGPAKPSEADPDRIGIMTFNVRHFETQSSGGIDIGAYADYILGSGADVVGLNEVYEDQLSALAKALRRRSPRTRRYVFFARGCVVNGRAYGNGIVSSLPLLDKTAVPIPDPEVPAYGGYYESRVLLTCAVGVNGKTLNICCTHFGLNPDEAENAVRTALATIKSERQILMGDLNMSPDDPLLDPIREKMTDTAPLLGENCLTFPSDEPDRKIDYIFLSPDLTALGADIPALALSDHRPYRCTVLVP